MERERYGDFGFDDPAELSRIKAEVSSSSLYNYGLFFTLVVAGIVYLILTLATGATEPTREAGREPETA